MSCCLSPPSGGEKSKPPAMRVVVDSTKELYMLSRTVYVSFFVGSLLLLLFFTPWIQAPPWTSKVYAQGQEGDEPAVPAAFLPSKNFKFEPVVEGTRVTHDFVIQNKGKAPLFIHKVKTG